VNPDRTTVGHHCAPNQPNFVSESQRALKELATLLSFSMLLNPGSADQVLVTKPNDPRFPRSTDSSAARYYDPNLALLDYPTPPMTIIITGTPACPANPTLCPQECDPGIGDKKEKCKKKVTVRAGSADYPTLAPIVDKGLIQTQVGLGGTSESS
jgi:hypothetical protein